MSLNPSEKAETLLSQLDQKILREGWSFHRRLQSAPKDGGETTELEAWQRLVSPGNTANFEKRLRWEEISKGSAAWAFDPPASATPQTPEWWPFLQALRLAGSRAVASNISQILCSRSKDQPFVHVWVPVAIWALETLKNRCNDLAGKISLKESAWFDLAQDLLHRICTTTEQALWEQFNHRRKPGDILIAYLSVGGDGSGKPSHCAYDLFVSELLESGYNTLFNDFPVLGRILAEITRLWLETSEEMLKRLADSRDDLAIHFGIRKEHFLLEICLGIGDPHRGGRSVAILSFGDDACTRKVVYKPKEMNVDLAYQNFLMSINQVSDLPPLRMLTVLTKNGYGFMEWVEHRTCNTDEDLKLFYTNAGRIMAILYLLGCTDCHHENFIAHSYQLLLIDTETLLEPDLANPINMPDNQIYGLSPLLSSLRTSVLRTGLLPQIRLAGGGRKRAYDVSALGIHPPPPEKESPCWLGINSDGMIAGCQLRHCELPTSLPVPLGSPERLSDFVDELLLGFVNQLREAQRIKSHLLAALKSFAGKPRRLVIRPTRLYYIIQRQMLAPSSLRNSVVHGLKLEQLSRSYLLAKDKPLNWPMFLAEIQQMEHLDIPFFEHLIDSADLRLSEDLPVISGLMAKSGSDAARRRIEDLDDGAINFQARLIRGALSVRHKTPLAPEQISSVSSVIKPNSDPSIFSSIYFQEATRLAENLWSSAIPDEIGCPEWLGMDLGPDGDLFQFGMIGPSLYSGTSGLALLFSRLSAISKGESCTNWSQRAWSCFKRLSQLADLRNTADLYRFIRDQSLGLSGLGGILLSLTCLQENGCQEAQQLSDALLNHLSPDLLKNHEGLDVLSGVAGLIGPLLAIRNDRSNELAIICGETLLSQQLECGAWPKDKQINTITKPLTGFSHGAAGIAASLAALFKATGESRWAVAVSKALGYERSVFVSDRGNWPDFRQRLDGRVFMTSWCHGAPGILLSRKIIQLAGLSDEACMAELDIARSTTLSAVRNMQDPTKSAPAHLCCGILGLTSILRIDAMIDSSTLSSEVCYAETTLIDHSLKGNDYIYIRKDADTLDLPGLFNGQAGVAFCLLEAGLKSHWLSFVLSAGLIKF